MKKSEMHLLAQALLCYFSDFLTKASNTARILYIENLPQNFTVKAKLFCPEIAGLFCRIAGLFCHDSRANLSLKPVCFGIAIS